MEGYFYGLKNSPKNNPRTVLQTGPLISFVAFAYMFLTEAAASRCCYARLFCRRVGAFLRAAQPFTTTVALPYAGSLRSGMVCRSLLHLPIVICFSVFPPPFPFLHTSILHRSFLCCWCQGLLLCVLPFLSLNVHVLLSFGSICRCHADMESALTSIVANVVHFLGASSRTR